MAGTPIRLALPAPPSPPNLSYGSVFIASGVACSWRERYNAQIARGGASCSGIHRSIRLPCARDWVYEAGRASTLGSCYLISSPPPGVARGRVIRVARLCCRHLMAFRCK